MEEKCKNRLLAIVGLGFWIFDFVTDILTLIQYWQTQSATIYILSTISVALSSLIAIWFVPRSVFVIWKGKNYNEDFLVALKCAESMFESAPQLIINLYVQSSCEQEIPVIQYISVAFSCIGVCVGVVSYDKVLPKDEDNEEVVPMNLLETVLLFLTKGFAIVARILILVYFAFYLGWWTALYVGIHSLIITVFTIAMSWGKWECKMTGLTGVVTGAVVFSVSAVWFQFVWFYDAVSYWWTAIFAVIYSVENAILLAISLNVKIVSDPYCLYPNVLWVHVGLNLGCLLFAILFITKRKSIQRIQPN